jgi:hypothetical protein
MFGPKEHVAALAIMVTVMLSGHSVRKSVWSGLLRDMQALASGAPIQEPMFDALLREMALLRAIPLIISWIVAMQLGIVSLSVVSDFYSKLPGAAPLDQSLLPWAFALNTLVMFVAIIGYVIWLVRHRHSFF